MSITFSSQFLKRRFARPFCYAFIVVFCLSHSSFAENRITEKISATHNFVHAQGQALFFQNKPILLQGINFANDYSEDLRTLDLLGSHHHSEIDFRRVKALGFNMIRLAFNGNWFEQNSAVFWAWLDRNITWAKKYHIYLVLDLHVPIGGYWLDESFEENDFSLWTDRKLQSRNIQLWKKIAKRLVNEPIIAAYDILNEPVVADKDGSQWKILAQEIVDGIRYYDRNHLIIVAPLYGVSRSYDDLKDLVPFLVNDDNVMYDFHFYEPLYYTHQYASWLATTGHDGGSYPNPKKLLPTKNAKLITTTTDKHPDINQGTSAWTEYASKLIEIEDPKIKFALPYFSVRGILQGEVFFDQITVSEFDEKGYFLQTIIADKISADSVLDWISWNNLGNEQPNFNVKTIDWDGVDDSHSLAITNVKKENLIVGWLNHTLRFKVKPYHQYRVKGFMKGNNVKINYGGKPIHVGFELDLYGESEEGKKVFLTLDREYLEREFMKYYQFGVNNNVPVSVMEFGVMHQTFEMRAKGGGGWVSDVLDILHKHQVSFAYWNYHGDDMGLYLSPIEHKPSQPNLPLLSTLRRKILEWEDWEESKEWE